MQRRMQRQVSRNKQMIGKTALALENMVKDTQAKLANTNGAMVEVPALDNPDSTLLKEIAELKIKLAAALEQGAMDALKAQRVEAIAAERDAFKQQLETLTATQPMPVAVTTQIECSIQYEVNPADLARWQNNGWCVKHYQFVNNDRDLPTLAVVMERPADAAPLTDSTYRYSATPKADDIPSNAESTPANEAVPAFTEIIIEEAEAVPSMAATAILPAENKRGDALLKKLAQDKPILSAIMEHGADAVIQAMDEQMYEKARAAYDAYAPADTPPRRFESLLTSGIVNPDTLTHEEIEIEVVLS